MKRAALSIGLALAGLGCESPAAPYHFLRVVVDTDLEAPTEIDRLSLTLERDGVQLTSETFDGSAIEALPDSFVILNESWTNDSPEKELETIRPITVTVSGLSGSTLRVQRSARLRFNRGQAQLPLPLCRVCLDTLCDAGQTCKRGGCASDAISSTRDLPPEADELVDALAECL